MANIYLTRKDEILRKCQEAPKGKPFYQPECKTVEATYTRLVSGISFIGAKEVKEDMDPSRYNSYNGGVIGLNNSSSRATNRQNVVRHIDQIVRYYHEHEDELKNTKFHLGDGVRLVAGPLRIVASELERVGFSRSIDLSPEQKAAGLKALKNIDDLGVPLTTGELNSAYEYVVGNLIDKLGGRGVDKGLANKSLQAIEKINKRMGENRASVGYKKLCAIDPALPSEQKDVAVVRALALINQSQSSFVLGENKEMLVSQLKKLGYVNVRAPEYSKNEAEAEHLDIKKMNVADRIKYYCSKIIGKKKSSLRHMKQLFHSATANVVGNIISEPDLALDHLTSFTRGLVKATRGKTVGRKKTNRGPAPK